MKKTQIIELLKTIKENIISYISILVFVMLGISLFVGLGWGTNSLLKNAEHTASDLGKIHDMEIFYPYGLSDEDIETLSQIEGVDAIEGTKYAYEFFKVNGFNSHALIHQMPENLDVFTECEGTLPEKDGEIAILRLWAEKTGVKIGDTIEFIPDENGNGKALSTFLNYDGDLEDIRDLSTDEYDIPKGMEYLNSTEYKVTAIVSYPMYIRYLNGASPENGIDFDSAMFVSDAAWKEQTDIGYTDIRIRSNSLRSLFIYSDAYDKKLKELKNTVFAVLDEITDKRNETLQSNLEQIPSDAGAELADAADELAKARKDLEDGNIKIEDAEKLIAESEKKLEDGEKELKSSQTLLNSGEDEYETGLCEYNEFKARIDEIDGIIGSIGSYCDGYESNYAQIKAEYAKAKQIINYAAEQLAEDASKWAVVNAYLKVNNPVALINDIMQSIASDLPKLPEIKEELQASVLKLLVLYSDLQEKYPELPDIPNAMSLINSIANASGYILDDPQILGMLSGIADYFGTMINDPSIAAYLDKIPQITKYSYYISLTVTYGQNIMYIEMYMDSINKLAAQILLVKEPTNAAELQAYLDGLQELEEQTDQLFALLDEFFDIYKELRQYISGLLADYKSQLDEGKAELISARAQLDKGWDEYYSGLKALEEGKQELSDAKQTLLEKKKEYSEGLEKYKDGKNKYDDAEADYDELKDSIPTLDSYDATVMYSTDNPTLMAFKSIYGCAEHSKYVMAILFVVVGILVCYSAVSRLIKDQMIRIGTKRALGLNQREVTESYLLFSGSAALIGSVFSIGLSYLVAWIMVKSIVGDAIRTGLSIYASFGELAIMAAIEILIIAFTTYFSCRNVLKQKAIRLLAGESNISGKIRLYEKWKLWDRLPLITKTIINNFFNDGRRVRSSLIGIISCTTLIVMALTVYYNGVGGFKLMSDEYYGFDSVVYYDINVDGAEEEVQAVLDDFNIGSAQVLMDKIMAEELDNNDFFVATVIVPQSMEEYEKFFKIDIYSGQDINEGDGTWVCHPFVIYNDISDNPVIKAKNTSGKKLEIPIDGSYKNYSTMAEIIMTPSKYEEIFDKEYEPDAYIISTEGVDVEALNAKLNEVEGFYYIRDFASSLKDNQKTFANLVMALVAIVLVLSVVMAFLVVLNLLSMFVSEKKRELIVLRINGYSVADAKKYIYSDTILLTVISIIIGCVIGYFVGRMTLSLMGCSCVCFLTELNFRAIIAGVLGTGLLVFITCRMALKEVGHLKLTDINK